MDGVYSDDQAARGKTVYTQNCGNCHLEEPERRAARLCLLQGTRS